MSPRTVIVGVRSRRLRIGFFGFDIDVTDLAQRDEAPLFASQSRSASCAGSSRSGPALARDDIDGADILAHLRDRHAGQQELQLLGRRRWATSRSAAGGPDRATKRSAGTRSPQSWFTWRICGLARITASTSPAMSRSLLGRAP